MIAAADAGNDRVMTGPAAAFDIVVELPEIAGRPAAMVMRARKILLQHVRIDLPPQASAGPRRLQPGSAFAQHGRPERGVHRNVAAALEEGMAEDAVEPRPEAFELVARHVGDNEAHAASDVGPGATRDHQSMGVHDGADRNAGALVEVRRQNATTDLPADIAEEAEAVEFLEGIGNARQRADLGEAGPIHRNGFVGKQHNVETGRRIDPDSHGIDPTSVDPDVGSNHWEHRS